MTVAPLCTNFNPDKLIEQNERIMRAWFECWLISHVPKLIDRPKWFDSDTDVKVGDVVLFLKKDKKSASFDIQAKKLLFFSARH